PSKPLTKLPSPSALFDLVCCLTGCFAAEVTSCRSRLAANPRRRTPHSVTSSHFSHRVGGREPVKQRELMSGVRIARISILTNRCELRDFIDRSAASFSARSLLAGQPDRPTVTGV